MAVRRLAVANGPNIFQMLLVLVASSQHPRDILADTPDTQTTSRGSSRGCHENVTRQLVSWNFSLMETRCCSNVGDSPFVAAEHESFNRISQMAPICTCPYVNSLFLGPTPVCSKQYLDQFSRSIGLTFTKLQNLIANIGCIFQTRVYKKISR